VGEFFLVALDNLGCFLHALGAHCEGSFSPRMEGLHRKLQLVFDFRLRERLESLDDFSGGGINSGYSHNGFAPWGWGSVLINCGHTTIPPAYQGRIDRSNDRQVPVITC